MMSHNVVRGGRPETGGRPRLLVTLYARATCRARGQYIPELSTGVVGRVPGRTIYNSGDED